tara:strand:- start:1113 stop:1277 length:165 start_codon:yes stop_codon:yes gene_type:complete
MVSAEISTFAFIASLLVITPQPNEVLIAQTIPTFRHASCPQFITATDQSVAASF